MKKYGIELLVIITSKDIFYFFISKSMFIYVKLDVSYFHEK